MTDKKIELKAEITLKEENDAIKVNKISPNPTKDLDYWLQVAGLLAYRSMKYHEWSREQIIRHVSESINKSISTHTYYTNKKYYKNKK